MEKPGIKPATHGLQDVGLSPTPRRLNKKKTTFCGFHGINQFLRVGLRCVCVGFMAGTPKVRKRANIRNLYNQAPHPTQDTNEKVTTSQLDITNESQEVSRFPSGDHKASTNIII